MIKKKSVYKCSKCGNLLEAVWNGNPTPSCCGQLMDELVPNTVEASKEKHIPVISVNGKTVTVSVGEVAHPMAADHYILFIELLVGNKVYRLDLPENGKEAKAEFCICHEEGEALTARAYCNLHGFWQSSK